MRTDDGRKLKVAITGVKGQLGLHCRARLQHKFGFDIIPIDRDGFKDDGTLAKCIEDADAIVHLAGANRGDEADVYRSNVDIANRLARYLSGAGQGEADVRGKAVVYASSVHALAESSYGRSKKEAANILADQCSKSGHSFLNLILPNLFGEFSKPFYNNFVGTFCQQAVHGEAMQVNRGAKVQLMHYGDVAELIGQCLSRRESGDLQPTGISTTVDEVADKIQCFHTIYQAGKFPDLSDAFDVRLFNSYRQVSFDHNPVGRLVAHSDNRGSFFECIRADSCGQTSFSTTVKSVMRGDHFHFNKVERFIVLAGQARISIRKLYDSHVHHFDVSGDKPVYIDMPTLHTHNIVNTGEDDLLTLFWTNEFFDPDNSDTYPEPV